MSLLLTAYPSPLVATAGSSYSTTIMFYSEIRGTSRQQLFYCTIYELVRTLYGTLIVGHHPPTRISAACTLLCGTPLY